jgi:hypothetical protein
VLLLGDLHHEGVRNVFERSDDDDLRWDVFLAPHHCSKSVLYASGPDGGEPTLQTDLRDQIEEAGEEGAYIISSSPLIPPDDTEGANPPAASSSMGTPTSRPGGSRPRTAESSSAPSRPASWWTWRPGRS